MSFFESAISLIITLGILVTIHEYGHYWVARKCGVKVLRFSVGFGRPIFSWKDRAGTEFAIASIPLGGYVKMLDEREAPVEEALKPYAFNHKPVGQRIAIVAAGPIANFLFAIIAYWLMFMSGFNTLIPEIGKVEVGSVAAEAGLQPGDEVLSVDGRATPGWRSVNMELINRIGDTGEIKIAASPVSGAEPEAAPQAQREQKVVLLPIDNWMLGQEPHSLVKALGINPARPAVKAVIDKVLPASAAEQGGLREGDEVFSVDGIEINGWFEFVELIRVRAEKVVEVKVRRSIDGVSNEVVLSLRPEIHIDEQGESVGRLGVSVKPFQYPAEMIRTVRYGPFDSFLAAADQTWADTLMTLSAIKKMILGFISLDNLSGPITIAQVASESIKTGSEEFLRFLAMLSVSLGVLNLLPIPVLDGGHLLYYIVELVRGKPVSEKWQTLGLKIGVAFILMLMTLALYNDLMRL